MYNKSISRNLFNIFFIFLGLIFFIIGIFILIYPQLKEKRCTESVVAKVVENIKDRSYYSDDNNFTRFVTYRPVFEFEYNGQNYNIQSNTSSNPPAFDVGEKVELKINPDNPIDFYAPSDRTFTFVGLIFIGIGLIFVAIGIVIRIIMKRNI